jgi:hypothetical protein
MPRIIVTADPPSEGDNRPIMFTERVNVSDFESPHFQTQLVERLGWAVDDADAVEQGRWDGDDEAVALPSTHVDDADTDDQGFEANAADEVSREREVALSGHRG